MNLEDFRNEDLGYIIWGIENKPATRIACPHTVYVKSGYRDIIEMLKRIENPKNMFYIHNDVSYMGMSTLWFLSIESFINSLLKLFCLMKKDNFDKYKAWNLHKRIFKVFDLAELDSSSFRKSGVLPELQEFQEFRSVIFHDTYNNKAINFKKTNFSKKPVFCNIIDVIQGMKIALEIFDSFRYILPGWDIMPNVPIHNYKKDMFYHEKLDEFWNKVFKSYVFKVFEKHNLETTLDFDYTIVNVKPAKISANEKIIIGIQATPTLKNRIKINENTSDYLIDEIENFDKNVIVKEGYFGIDDYTIR